MKRYILIFISLMFAMSTLSAVSIKITNKKSKLYNEIDQSYDIKKSWWWYEETIPVEDNNATSPKHSIDKKIRYKVTPVENNQLKLLKQMVSNQTDTINELKKVVNILEYNFPKRFKKWTINKKTGKKCLSNSSGDCYVPILIPEAQQVPAMAAFLRDPSMKNAKNYLGFQAAHFNHVMKVGYGLSFAYKQYGKEAYPTSSMLGTGSPTGDAGKYRYGAQFALLQNIQKRLTFYVFLGKTDWMEKRIGMSHIAMAKRNILSTFDNFYFVHYNNESKETYEKLAKNKGLVKEGTYNKAKIIVSPELFKKFKIDYTPFVVVVYKDTNGRKIWQKLSYNTSVKGILKQTYDFLEYNGVFDPKNISEDTVLKLKSYQPNDMYLDAEAAGLQIKPKTFNIKNINKDQILNKRKEK